jgi:hypothetical protein
MKTRTRYAAVLVSLALLLSACSAPSPSPSSVAGSPSASSPIPAPSETTAVPTPTPTPTPEQPTLQDLVLTQDGLSTLIVGEQMDPRLTVLDPRACAQGDSSEPAPGSAGWVPLFPMITGPYGRLVHVFEPHADENGDLRWLAVQSPEILTDRGIGIGSSSAEVEAAYPDAEVLDGAFARVYEIAGPVSRLVIEVRTEDTFAFTADRVWTMRVEALDFSLGSLAGGDAGVFCPA